MPGVSATFAHGVRHSVRPFSETFVHGNDATVRKPLSSGPSLTAVGRIGDGGNASAYAGFVGSMLTLISRVWSATISMTSVFFAPFAADIAMACVPALAGRLKMLTGAEVDPVVEDVIALGHAHDGDGAHAAGLARRRRGGGLVEEAMVFVVFDAVVVAPRALRAVVELAGDRRRRRRRSRRRDDEARGKRSDIRDGHALDDAAAIRDRLDREDGPERPAELERPARMLARVPVDGDGRVDGRERDRHRSDLATRRRDARRRPALHTEGAERHEEERLLPHGSSMLAARWPWRYAPTA